MSHQMGVCRKCNVKHWGWQKHNCQMIVCLMCGDSYWSSKKHTCAPALVEAHAARLELAEIVRQHAQWDAARRPRDMESWPNAVLIAIMWALTAIGIPLIYLGGFSIAFFPDIPAIVIAIVLVCSKNSTDKVNGWVKLVLEFVAFAVSFLAQVAMQTRPSPY